MKILMSPTYPLPRFSDPHESVNLFSVLTRNRIDHRKIFRRKRECRVGVLLYFSQIHTHVPTQMQNRAHVRTPYTRILSDCFFLRTVPFSSIYDRSTGSYKPPYFSVYGHLRLCLFDLSFNCVAM